ncbi:hypothetical protein [Thalassoporum mexicanum]|uniref:hypothetical protein n=1 Tax=Thalassoporum mexicanum TaxID=3457544 RepID=UPI0005A01E7B|nr:hypothetical protein [Pseudanabaena sp. PCC 7367]
MWSYAELLIAVVGISFGALSIGLPWLAPSIPPIQAQVTTDGTTATTVDGHQINPVGPGTVNGNNLFHSFDQFNVPSGCVIFGTDGSSVDGNSIKKSW